MKVFLKFVDEMKKARGLLLGLAQRVSLAIIDQVLISATNLITMVLLARGMSPAEFGDFTLFFLVLQSAMCVQAGLVIIPFCVLSTRYKGADYTRYTTSTAASQFLLAAFFTLASLVAWGITFAIGWEKGPSPLLLIAPLVAWQFQEFFRRILYTAGRFGAVLVNDVISFGGQSVVIACLYHWGRLGVFETMAAIAVTSAAAALLGAYQVRADLRGTVDREAIRSNWQFGKWLAASDLTADLLFNQLSVFMASTISGPSSVGVIKAVCTIFGPSRVVNAAMNLLLPLEFAKALAASGEDGLRRIRDRAYMLLVPTLGAFDLALAVFAGPLLRTFYGTKYAGEVHSMWAWAFFDFMCLVSMVSCNTLKAKGLSRAYFGSRIAAGLISIPFTLVMIHFWGAVGAILGMATAYVIFTLEVNLVMHLHGASISGVLARFIGGPRRPKLVALDERLGRSENREEIVGI